MNRTIDFSKLEHLRDNSRVKKNALSLSSKVTTRFVMGTRDKQNLPRSKVRAIEDKLALRDARWFSSIAEQRLRIHSIDDT